MLNHTMEKMLRPYEKECMRLAMLKHEETFKEQVYELHRLYRIQKMLMKSMQSSNWNKNNLHHHLQQQSSRITSLDLERPAEEFIAESGCNRMLEIIDESEIKLTLGPPANYSRRKKNQATTPLTLDSGPSFSSSSAESSHVNRTKEEFLQGTDMRNKIGIDIDIEGQLKQPPWLFQVLSL